MCEGDSELCLVAMVNVIRDVIGLTLDVALSQSLNHFKGCLASEACASKYIQITVETLEYKPCLFHDGLHKRLLVVKRNKMYGPKGPAI
jgi:hypothetical protein